MGIKSLLWDTRLQNIAAGIYYESIFGVAGGIYNYGALTITNSTISGNTAVYEEEVVFGPRNCLALAVFSLLDYRRARRGAPQDVTLRIPTRLRWM